MGIIVVIGTLIAIVVILLLMAIILPEKGIQETEEFDEVESSEEE